MDLDAPVPTSVFANGPLKLPYARSVTLFVIVTILALFLVSHRSPDRIAFSKGLDFEFVCSRSLLEGGVDIYLPLSYFKHFAGQQDCGVVSTEIYRPPVGKLQYCKSRKALLEALTGGGRHGFDMPFFPNGCHYRWFTTAEVCMVLERFDAVIFLGEGMVHSIYGAFNILLRENVALGALKQWEMSIAERDACRCDNQFVGGQCTRFVVTANEEVARNDGVGKYSSPYFCDRIVHAYISLTASPSPATSSQEMLKSLIKSLPQTYKPIPVVHSLPLNTHLSYNTATSSMDEWISFSDSLDRSLPLLWLGPAAMGNLKPRSLVLGREHNALWNFSVGVGEEARAREMEMLGMYNATLQASSRDGTGYGLKVSLMQAMMIINWLSMLETT